MFTDMSKLRLGNVNDNDIFSADEAKTLINKFENFSKKTQMKYAKIVLQILYAVIV